MDEQNYLYKTLETEFGKRNIESVEVPTLIMGNLNQSLPIRPYQKKAFQYFLNYWNETFEGKLDKPQLLFHMATGSGKTLIMAGLILYMYEKGYRNFLFFVNSTNIIEKTKDNFLNNISIKYLFNDPIKNGDKRIEIRAVDNFQATSEDCINIAFSTIQGLHTRLNNPQENSLTYDDFQDKKIVLISDEAHHINVETKAGIKTDITGEIEIKGKLAKEELEEIISWEGTVNRIFNANPQNVLLEFTATMDLNNPNIVKKYASKILFDYPLKQFRIDGYSKDVNVLQSDEDLFERALQACLLSQYRRKIFEKNRILIKPVLLFKSKTIQDSKDFQELFTSRISDLQKQHIEAIKNKAQDAVLKNMFSYFEANSISFENLIAEIKEDFGPNKCISVNSKEESEEKQIAVNTLEDPNNEYRAIFAVDKLNEGWDVLNLFDIVRLYDTRDAKDNRPGETTIKEAQLIGRGARYCPFKLQNSDDKYKRKFDEDLENEMRICEELYYHSSYNPKYIQELRTALVKTGIVADKTTKKKMLIKDDFKSTKFYKSGVIYLNEQTAYRQEDVFGIPSSIRDTLYSVSLRTGYSFSSDLFEDNSKDKGIAKKAKNFALKDFNSNIIRKAIYKLDFYSFSNLRNYFPHLKSITEFITSENYLGKVKIEISGYDNQLQNLSPDEILDALVQTLEEISVRLASGKLEHKGSFEFTPYLLKDKIKDKELSFTIDESEDKEFGKSMIDPQETNIFLDLSNKSWYVFNDCLGTSEEKYFVKYIDKVYENLVDKYEEIFLVRNEKFFKIYNFDDGQAFEPDFVLFLLQKGDPKFLYYQVFIEPKGSHLTEKDQWKNNLLESLKEKVKFEDLYDSKEYSILGMPFYNYTNETAFENDFTSKFL